MNLEQIKTNVMEALRSLKPTEVRVRKENADVVKILVLSNQFKDVRIMTRIETCSRLLVRHAGLHYLFIIEPVTPEEFKERLMPWPE